MGGCVLNRVLVDKGLKERREKGPPVEVSRDSAGGLEVLWVSASQPSETISDLV